MPVSCPAVRVGWQLPAVEMEYPDSLERYKLFSRFFLEGQVLQQNQSSQSLFSQTDVSISVSVRIIPYLWTSFIST